MVSQEVLECRCHLLHLRLRGQNIARNFVEANSEAQWKVGTLSTAPPCMSCEAVGDRSLLPVFLLQCVQAFLMLVLEANVVHPNRLLLVNHRSGFAPVAGR